jgi:hypothetical protein
MAAPKPKKAKTLEDVLDEIKAVKEEAVVYLALSNYLRTKYLPRDSMPEPSKLSCEGAPVRIETIDEVAAALEEQARERKDQVLSLLKEVVND